MRLILGERALRFRTLGPIPWVPGLNDVIELIDIVGNSENEGENSFCFRYRV